MIVSTKPARVRYAHTAYGAQVVPGGTPFLSQGDFTYLGSFRMPATVTYSSTVVSTAFGRAAIAYRGKGGVDRILMTSHNTTPSTPVDLRDAVYEVTVPALSTIAPYNFAGVYKAWGDVYDGKRRSNNGGSLWTNGLYIDPGDWDTLRWNSFQFYDGGPEASWGKSSLDDGTETATGIASWSFTGTVSQQTGGGCLKMPAAFVAANCPGKPYLVGFGGAWMSTVANASVGPAFRATVDPDLPTYPDNTALPNIVLMRHARASSPPVGELRARRATDYADQVFGTCAAGTSTTQIVLDANAYDTGTYAGRTAGIYAGTGSGQSGRTLTWVSGRTYSVSPAFSPAPIAGDSKYELSGGGGNDAIAGGYWTFGDISPQSTVWVDGTKRGVCVLVAMATNRQFYGPGGPHYENLVHRMRVYNSNDLAAIAAGSINPWAAESVAEWDFALPGITYPAWTDSQTDLIANMALDVANRKLYISHRDGWWDGFEWHPFVHVYQIAGSN